MSGIMKLAERNWELGLSKVPEKSVCSSHFDDSGIRNFINAHAVKGRCDYCGRSKKVVELEEVMVCMLEAVRYFYTDPANFLTYNTREGGYLGNVYDANEILQDHWSLDISDNALLDDVIKSIDFSKAWANETDYHDTPEDILRYSWDYFKEVITKRSRYFFNSVRSLDSSDYRLLPAQILSEIGKKIHHFKLISQLPIGTKLYRCRQHQQGDESVRTAKGMTSPPDDYAVQPNRMSPAGISMFYGAFNEETAIVETIDKEDVNNPYYTVAEFSTTSEINVIDLTNLPPLPSRFDARKRHLRFPIEFLQDFVEDLIKPIERDRKVHINYVPTQAITEYFRYPFSDKIRNGKRIHGLIYPSSRNHKRACVLFYDNKESLKVLHSNPDTYSEYLISNG